MTAIFRHLRETAAVFRVVAGSPRLRLVALARLLSVTGRWASMVALGVVAYRDGGAQAVALLALVRILPAAAAGPLATILLGRLRSRDVLLVSGVGRTAAVAGLAAVLYAHAGIAGFYVLAGVMSLLSPMSRPLQTAALPFLVASPRELTSANLTLTTIESVGMLSGPALAGLVLSVSTPATVLAVTAAAYGLAALLVRLLPAWEGGGAPVASRRSGGFATGLRTIHGDPPLRLVAGLYTAENLVAGALNVLVVVAALDLLSLGASGVGVLNAAIGIGGVTGALAVGALVGPGRIAAGLGLGLLLCGASLGAIAGLPRLSATVVLLAFVGTGIAIVNFSAMTLLQRTVPDGSLAGVLSLLQSLFMASLGTGALIAPALVGGLGVRGALLACGSVLPVLAALRWRALRRLDSVHAADDQAVELLRGISIFAPLPLPALERLARALRPVEVAAGAVVVREGEAGDLYYAVRSGRLRISSEGREVAVLGVGEGFGEIALLRNVPRTATATALEDSRLYSLDSDSFLESVVGTPTSQGAADELVETRLAELRAAVASI